jgi:hypothetical protein
MSKVNFIAWPKANLAPGKLTKLVRPDGSADLAYDGNGQLVRLFPKVSGKALKKRTKKIRAELRRQEESAP